MTTSSRMEHQESVRPVYPHELTSFHRSSTSVAVMSNGSLTTATATATHANNTASAGVGPGLDSSDSSNSSLESSLACLSAAAVAVAAASTASTPSSQESHRANGTTYLKQRQQQQARRTTEILINEDEQMQMNSEREDDRRRDGRRSWADGNEPGHGDNKDDVEMNPVKSETALDSNGHDYPHRSAMAIDQVETLTPTPSPHGRPEASVESKPYTNGHHAASVSSSSTSSQEHLHYQDDHQSAASSSPYGYHSERTSNPNANNTHNTNSIGNGHTYPGQVPSHQQHQQPHYPPPLSSTLHSGSHPTPTTPSPPLPSPTEAFQRRPLPPIEPSHPLHGYMSNSRRGSVADPEYHASAAADPHRRPSMAGIESSPGYYTNGPPPPPEGPAPSSSPSRPLSASYGNASSPSASSPVSSEHHYHPHPAPPPPSHQHHHYNQGASPSSHPSHHGHGYPHPSTSPLQLRQSEYALGRRESLPSIHSSAGPLGQLLAQEPQRRHSIAHGDNTGPLKRKTSSLATTPLSQVHSSSSSPNDTNGSSRDRDFDHYHHNHHHPSKRRDSIPDVAVFPYPARSSLSAPSSPPRRGSIAARGSIPTLNLQPAAEIKPSSMSSSGSPGASGAPTSTSSPLSSQNGNRDSGMIMDHVRPHYPLHQPRRPSLLSSEASLSRRSSLADLPHYPSHYSSSSSQHNGHSNQDYDYHMNMDMERMHLSSHGPEPGPYHAAPPSHSYSGGTAPPPPPPSAPSSASSASGHMYGGYAEGSIPPSSHHHHPPSSTSQHLQPPPPTGSAPGSGALAKGETPYSRSPELRVSHKLAERKRRKEMKELFDELRDSLPVDRSLKTSKWEILSKAVDFISSLKVNQDELSKEIESLRQELTTLRKN